MKIISPPKIISRLYYSMEWEKTVMGRKQVYLTFDDGPTPQVTDFVLNQLNQHQVKATFFCVGKNIASEPQIFANILNEKHHIGNHTQNHLNGWKTSCSSYIADILKCTDTMNLQGYLPENKPLFRPPYGKITREQIKALKDQYRIVMWSILAYDWMPHKSQYYCLNTILSHLKNGAIIALHDSHKAAPNITKTLPLMLPAIKDKGYDFALL